MATKVSICNEALVILKQKQVASIPQSGSAPSYVLDTIYDSRVEYLLRSHVWKFAKDRVILAPNTDTPAFDWAYSFNLPSGFLRLIKTKYIVEGDYEIEGRCLLSNSDTIYLNYVKKITDPNLFDETFRLALAALLARDGSRSITGKFSNEAAALYAQYIDEAMFNNSIEMPSEEIEADDWILSRL